MVTVAVEEEAAISEEVMVVALETSGAVATAVTEAVDTEEWEEDPADMEVGDLPSK